MEMLEFETGKEGIKEYINELNHLVNVKIKDYIECLEELKERANKLAKVLSEFIKDVEENENEEEPKTFKCMHKKERKKMLKGIDEKKEKGKKGSDTTGNRVKFPTPPHILRKRKLNPRVINYIIYLH